MKKVLIIALALVSVAGGYFGWQWVQDHDVLEDGPFADDEEEKEKQEYLYDLEAIVTEHPVENREDINKLEAPEEDIGFPHGFMFLRLADLRGYENLMMDFAEEPPELKKLIKIVLDYMHNYRSSSIVW